MTKNELLDIIIIGGGISGLYILDHLLSNFQTKDLKIRLFEKENYLGGRIKTIYEENGKVKFETGPWRFHNSHSRIKKLIEKYQLPYQQTTSSLSESFHQQIDYCQTSQNKKRNQKLTHKSINSSSSKSSVAGLSMMDNMIYQNDYCYYKDQQLYHNTPKIMDSTNNVHCSQNEDQGIHYFLPTGFSQLIEKMTYLHKNQINLNSFIDDIIYLPTEKQYQLQIITNNQIKYFKTQYLFFCLPPHFTRYWTISKLYLKPLIFSVDTLSLSHLYGYDSNLSNFHQNKFQVFTTSSLDQVVSGNYQNKWFQVAYNLDARADFWKHMIQLFPGKIKKIINQTLAKMNLKLKISDYHQCYTEKAVHYWNSNYGFNLQQNVLKSIYPDPVNLPGLFWAGEAFSSNQGWIEGALETAELAIKQFYQVFNHQYHFYPIIVDAKLEYLILDNRVLDVSQWKKVHPGSIQSINNHLQEDISQLFRMINHKEYSWAIALNLQKYWLYQGQIGYFK